MINNRMQTQQGVVIIMALFIMALVAALAIAMMARLERDTRRTSLYVHDITAQQYAQGSIAWAQDVLRTNWENRKPNQLIDKMPLASVVEDKSGYTITSTLYDMQARYNINNLANHNRDAQVDFKRLLAAVDPALNDQAAEAIIVAIVDWLTPATQQTEYDKYYIEAPTPYRSAHRLMESISELRLVKGMTPRLYQALQPYVIALPNQTVVNVATATIPVLLTLSPAITLDIAKAIEKKRQETPFATPDIFRQVEGVSEANIAPEKIATSSAYFLLETKVAIDSQQLVFYTLLERVASTSTSPTITILWQTKGTL